MEFTEINDLYIELDNSVCVQILTSNGPPHYVDNCEQWRVFDNTDETAEHIIVYSDAIE